MSLRIRRMELTDLEKVLEIDQLSFSLPWPKSTFRFELVENELSRCWVGELERLFKPVEVVSMAVVWMVVNDAHIATIAVHPAFRRLGIAKQMMAHIIQAAEDEKMDSVTLEVRVSNEAAQNLYAQFGFKVVGKRPRYYRDTNEDALIMTKEFDMEKGNHRIK
jgi:[ribosomal protein S18]-alanine N-acetyltransferase